MSDRPQPPIRRLVRLREEERVEVDETSIRQSGRYSIRGKIADGAVGEILLAHDEAIGRDLVLKLLREEHVGDPASVQRFVEEAQVAGQLQHPGVIPVYELGMHDERPFFAMRFVKGKTLAAMLAERANPGERLHELLSIFLQVCEPVAYAHARGVIHCNVKPANVLVGPFGEVQVVDWAAARVLRHGGTADERLARNESTIVRLRQQGAGRADGAPVVGTPAYMSPEQALGQLHALDPRTDVFALGGTLCELLTGRPPYDGDDARALEAAVHGRIEPAFERLAACGAAEDLVALARRCLAPERSKRPRDAAQVARGIAKHLVDADDKERRARLAVVEARQAAAQEKARRAKAEAELAQAKTKRLEEKTKSERDTARAEAEAFRAEELVRGRRRVLIIAACAVLVVAVGLLGYASVLTGRAERVQQAERDVHALLVEGQQLRGAGKWAAAAAVAKRAAERASTEPVAEELAQRVDQLEDEIEAGQRAEAAEVERVRTYEDLVVRLADARLLRGTGVSARDQIAAFVQAFGAAGIEPSVPENAGEFRAAIRGAYLEYQLLKGARQAPPPQNLEQASAIDAALAGLGLIQREAYDEARAWLQQAYYRHAGDPWITFYLALALTWHEQPRYYEARSYLSAVETHFPQSEPLRRTRERIFSGSDLEGVRMQHGWEDADRWLVVPMKHSVVTGTARRIRIPKAAITQALLGHAGGEQWDAAKLVYPDGTVFFAEDLDGNGKPVVTRMMIARPGRLPNFRAFDAKGIEVPLVGSRKSGGAHIVPTSCRGCHAGRNYYEPMQSFPRENAAWRIQLGAEYRDMKPVLKFLEAFHRGGFVFGPYGAMWINKLRADAAAGTLSETDRPHYEKLAAKFPDLFATE